MRLNTLHPWDLSPTEARRLQSELAARIDVTPAIEKPRWVAGADVSMMRGDPRLYAAVVLLDFETMQVVESVNAAGPADFPYVPGLLSFREAPALLDAFAKLRGTPDVVICDGQGIAHPRRLGIASHLGLWLGVPTIGCAKSRLCGQAVEPGPARGDRSDLIDRGQVVGTVLRSRNRVSPLFISPGHLCNLDSAVQIVLDCGRGRRLPEPSRRAHEYVNKARCEASPA